MTTEELIIENEGKRPEDVLMEKRIDDFNKFVDTFVQDQDYFHTLLNHSKSHGLTYKDIGDISKYTILTLLPIIRELRRLDDKIEDSLIKKDEIKHYSSSESPFLITTSRIDKTINQNNFFMIPPKNDTELLNELIERNQIKDDGLILINMYRKMSK